MARILMVLTCMIIKKRIIQQSTMLFMFPESIAILVICRL